MRQLVIAVAMMAQGFALAAGTPLAQMGSVTGLVRIAHPGSPTQDQAVAGMPLAEGDRVSCLAGRAEIRFTDGHVLRLVENSVLEIMGPVQRGKRGVFTRLFAGRVRAIVARLTADTSFEVQSSYAVASVKGTDLFFDGLIASVRPEGDGVVHTLELTSADGKSRLEIRDGMSGGFSADGSVVEPKAVDAAFFDALERAFDVTAPSSGTPAGGTPPAGGTGGGTTPPAGGEGTSIDRDALRADLADFAGSHELGEYADFLEHAGDVALGAALIDMHGYRVRTEEFVRLAAPDTIQFLVLNSREEGPNAGVSSYQDDLKFNQALPANYEDVRRNLAATFADPAHEPPYWPVSEEARASSPRGDTVRREALFGTPQAIFTDEFPDSFNTSTFSYNYVGGNAPGGWGQTTETRLWINEIPKEHFLHDQHGYIVGGWYAGVAPGGDPATWPEYPYYPTGSQGAGSPSLWSNGPDAATGLYPVDPLMDAPSFPTFVVSGLPVFGNAYFGAGSRTFSLNSRGGFTGETIYGDKTFLRESFFFVSDKGTVIDPLASAAGGGMGLEAAAPEHVNFELEWEASEFADPAGGEAHTIDIMITPEIFGSTTGGTPTPTMDQAPVIQQPM
ncbi:MAG: FecR family protein [Candidatus Coatesbacteria bacterium]